jgi:hypothetical protein
VDDDEEAAGLLTEARRGSEKALGALLVDGRHLPPVLARLPLRVRHGGVRCYLGRVRPVQMVRPCLVIRTGNRGPKKSAPAVALVAVAAGVRNGRQGGLGGR